MSDKVIKFQLKINRVFDQEWNPLFNNSIETDIFVKKDVDLNIVQFVDKISYIRKGLFELLNITKNYVINLGLKKKRFKDSER